MPWAMFAYYMTVLIAHQPFYTRPFISIMAYCISTFITQPRVVRNLNQVRILTPSRKPPSVN